MEGKALVLLLIKINKNIIEIFNKGIDEAKTDGFYDTLIKNMN